MIKTTKTAMIRRTNVFIYLKNEIRLIGSIDSWLLRFTMKHSKNIKYAILSTAFFTKASQFHLRHTLRGIITTCRNI